MVVQGWRSAADEQSHIDYMFCYNPISFIEDTYYRNVHNTLILKPPTGLNYCVLDPWLWPYLVIYRGILAHGEGYSISMSI